MSISTDQFTAIVTLIEDGELDNRMAELQQAIDDRNGRRKEDILKLVKSVWGEAAQIVGSEDRRVDFSELATQEIKAQRAARKEKMEYQADDGPAIPASASDSAGATWPTPIPSQGTTGPGAGFSPVSDPMVSGGSGLGGSLGDGDPNFSSTGGQIG